jgi:alpha-N-acetylglucosamine transferase
MVQISAHTPHTKFEEKEEELLRKLRIRLLYIPKFRPDTECFYSLVLETFRILSLTDYTRVMFMDYDMFPRHSLDYIFELSDPPTTATGITTPLLKENVVLGNKVEPSNAGLFLLKPNAGDYFQLHEIIHKREVRAVQIPYPHWNQTEGWVRIL